MKVLHVPYCYYPDPVGGTEVYVAHLVRELKGVGVCSEVAAPSEEDAEYEWDGTPVHRFQHATNHVPLKTLYGGGDVVAARSFGRVLDAVQPEVVHLHALSPAVSVLQLREATRRGLRTVFTYHTPTVSCMRGSLMRWGTTPCSGVLDVRACSACALQGHGLPRAAAQVVAGLPLSLGDLLGRVELEGGPWTALRTPSLARLRFSSLQALLAEVDHVVAVRGWIRDVLLRNGIPGEKMTVSPHGVDSPLSQPPLGRAERTTDPASPLRVAFLGRFDPVKGAHVLVDAVRSLPPGSVELDLYAVVQGSGARAYTRAIHGKVEGCPSIHILDALPNTDVVSTLSTYDLLAVPSQGLETGPLVVLEAFAAGIPVIGSDLGGIKELVEHGVDGLVVEPGSTTAWRRALESLARDRQLLNRLRSGVRSPRTASDTASDMVRVYSSLVPTPTLLSC